MYSTGTVLIGTEKCDYTYSITTKGCLVVVTGKEYTDGTIRVRILDCADGVYIGDYYNIDPRLFDVYTNFSDYIVGRYIKTNLQNVHCTDSIEDDVFLVVDRRGTVLNVRTGRHWKLDYKAHVADGKDNLKLLPKSYVHESKDKPKVLRFKTGDIVVGKEGSTHTITGKGSVIKVVDVTDRSFSGLVLESCVGYEHHIGSTLNSLSLEYFYKIDNYPSTIVGRYMECLESNFYGTDGKIKDIFRIISIGKILNTRTNKDFFFDYDTDLNKGGIIGFRILPKDYVFKHKQVEEPRTDPYTSSLSRPSPSVEVTGIIKVIPVENRLVSKNKNKLL